MTTDWRVYGSSTVVSTLDKTEFPGFFRSLVVGPNEAAVIIRDGKIEETITGKRKSTSGLWDKFKQLWGRSTDLEVVFVDISPIDFAFYVGSSSRQESGAQLGFLSESREDAYNTIESRARGRVDTTDLTIRAITRDGQAVSAEVNITLQLKAEDAPLLTGLLRGRRAIADWDIAALVRDELLAKSLVPLIGQHSGSEIRANQSLMAEISQVSEKTLKNKFELYGLELINMFVNWGLTEEDELIIAEGHKDRETRAIEFDHTRSVREQKRELELERQHVSNLQELRNLEASGEVDLQEIILTGEINRESLVDGKKINQATVAAEVEKIELEIQQKENVLRIETTKAEADARSAIEQRQALFDHDLKTKDDDRRQKNLTAESQIEMAEMAQLAKLQIERQAANRQGERETATQASDAAQKELQAKLDSSLADSKEVQQTIRQQIASSPDAVDPSVLKEMLKQSTNRAFAEASDAKMESLSQSQRAPQNPEPATEKDRTTSEMAGTAHNAESSATSAPAESRCTSCSLPIQASSKFCPSCGTPVIIRCGNCSAELKTGWNNCPQCGLTTN